MNPNNKRRAFSLIEMLVAIAVLAILAVIVSSGVSGARRQGDQAKNVAQLRNIGLACHAYAADHGGKVPVNAELDPWPTAGRWVGRGSGLRALLTDKWQGGTGDSDYLPSPDAFYGPFTPKLDRLRQPHAFVPNGIHFEIGYVYYSLPSVGRNTNEQRPSLEKNLSNDYLIEDNDPSTPLLSDVFTQTMIEETGFDGPKCTVLRLDGSVVVLEKSKVAGLTSLRDQRTVSILAGRE